MCTSINTIEENIVHKINERFNKELIKSIEEMHNSQEENNE